MISTRNLALSWASGVLNTISKRESLQRVIFNAIRLNKIELRRLVEDENVRFLCYCISRRDRSKAQILQDLWVCFELGEKRDGFFVEFGATDGLRNSNTWYLEKELGWSGILAEPNPIWQSDLSVNRNASIETRCISSRSGELVSFLVTDDTDPELSGIERFSSADHFAKIRSKARRIELETISLDDLFDKYNAPQTIDYMSIDTEGSELDILSSYSFRHKFKLISVENNRENERLVEELLASKGYVRVFRHFSQWDSWFIATDLRSGKPFRIVAPEA